MPSANRYYRGSVGSDDEKPRPRRRRKMETEDYKKRMGKTTSKVVVSPRSARLTEERKKKGLPVMGRHQTYRTGNPD